MLLGIIQEALENIKHICCIRFAGPRVPQFQSFGSSIFYTVCLGFGAPFIHSMPPVAFIVAAVGLLVFWVVFVPLLVAVNIQSLSTVIKKVRTEQRETLGESTRQTTGMSCGPRTAVR